MCDIKDAIKSFLDVRTPNERYSSFDYCYNYFYSFYRDDRLKDLSSKENVQMSCLQLGFYLASWGMFRGSSTLLKKSVKYFKPLIEWLSEADKSLWEIDVDSYNREDIQKSS